MLGEGIGYFLGMHCNRPILTWLFNEKKIGKVDALFEKYGVYAVGLAAFSPLPFKLFTISASVARMNILSSIF
ncbi:MAG: VTT domain-containing protein [Candidatus Altiarchaeota archaeon]|nr:VTT domain-containing protein [Candidatus Altiarchaeota archaeon]